MEELIKDMFFKKDIFGFTLIELLVTMAILGILSTLGLGAFRSSQMKSRDARRKSDLNNIQKALEMFQSDHGVYPLDDAGEIVLSDTVSLDWKGREQFKDPDKNTVYMQELPNDPNNSPNYCYVSDGTAYQLYTTLENTEDRNLLTSPQTCGECDDCDNNCCYNYGVSSSNTTP